MRAICEYRVKPTAKQLGNLNKWESDHDINEDDRMTEDDESDYYFSDDS